VIRNIIFDWSGTLVDDLPAVLQASNYILTQAGRPVMTLEQFRAEFSLPFSKFYDRHTPHIEAEQLEEWFHAEFRRAQASVVELPYAREFLEFCRQQKVRTFLLSSVHTDHYAVQCRATGFGPYIDKAYTDIYDKRTKIHDILAENDVNPAETIFIGDMQHDIETARHGGVHSVGVLTGYNTLGQLRAAGPDLIVEHLGELRRILVQNDWNLKPSAEKFEASHPPLATVGALIFNEVGDVLMIRTDKWSGLWGIPGGKIKWGETSENALRREILEETALTVTDIKFVVVQDCICSPEFYHEAHFVLLNYTCVCVGEPKVKLNEEAREYCWIAPAAARELPLNTPTRILLAAVIKS
jgi:phosphoglycolate phosphatase-like HAD superfamily hydrolase/ADP-ribose pyrophosphatase YjhB (NUDIX family)